MPGLIPAAINAVNNPTPGMNTLQNIGHQVLPRIPYYNLAGSLYHLLTGTLGEHGQSPSIIGRITQTLFPGIGQQPQGPTSPAMAGGGAPQGPGAFGGDPTDPNNPGAYSLNDPGGNQSPGGNNPSAVARIQQILNTGRVPEFPAFYPTLAQIQFPGSRIGPTNPVSNPYNPNARTPTFGYTHPSGVPGWAQAFSSLIASKNQL